MDSQSPPPREERMTAAEWRAHPSRFQNHHQRPALHDVLDRQGHRPSPGRPSEGARQMNSQSVFGEVIHHYSRAQAIADGVLVDVTETARELGFRAPVAVTAAAWSRCVAWQSDEEADQDEQGRLWDVLWLACLAARSAKGQSEVGYTLRVVQAGGVVEQMALRLCIGPDDASKPAITILMPNED